MLWLTRSLKVTFWAVFLRLLWEGVVQCSLLRLIRGSLKVMHLAVFLKLPEVGEVETVRVSIWEWVT